jgi:hypothetical protein
MRLNFANVNEEITNEGVYRLGVAMRYELVRCQGGCLYEIRLRSGAVTTVRAVAGY